MPSLYEIAISSHFAQTRVERCERLNAVLGGNWGNIICISHQIESNAWRAITDTGLFVILSEDKKTLVTCYLATLKRAKMLYDLANMHLPKTLQKRIEKNADKYYKLYHEQL